MAEDNLENVVRELTKEENLEKAVHEINEATALHKESLLLNGYKEISNHPDYMYQQIEGKYIFFKRNDKDLYNPITANISLNQNMHEAVIKPDRA
jgi:hypothetical protein